MKLTPHTVLSATQEGRLPPLPSSLDEGSIPEATPGPTSAPEAPIVDRKDLATHVPSPQGSLVQLSLDGNFSALSKQWNRERRKGDSSIPSLALSLYEILAFSGLCQANRGRVHENKVERWFHEKLKVVEEELGPNPNGLRDELVTLIRSFVK